jgi:hypothetical protein
MPLIREAAAQCVHRVGLWVSSPVERGGGSRPQGRNTRVEHCLSAVHNRSGAAHQPSTLPDGDGDRGLMRTKRQPLQFEDCIVTARQSVNWMGLVTDSRIF